jgi:hypothetical protein
MAKNQGPDKGGKDEGASRWTRNSRTLSFWVLFVLVSILLVQLFSPQPPDATELSQVHTVYADHACAELGTHFEWPEVVRSTGPLAMDLTTDPATVLLPSQALPDQEGVLYIDRVRDVIPATYHEVALAHEVGVPVMVYAVSAGPLQVGGVDVHVLLALFRTISAKP